MAVLQRSLIALTVLFCITQCSSPAQGQPIDENSLAELAESEDQDDWALMEDEAEAEEDAAEEALDMMEDEAADETADEAADEMADGAEREERRWGGKRYYPYPPGVVPIVYNPYMG